MPHVGVAEWGLVVLAAGLGLLVLARAEVVAARRRGRTAAQLAALERKVDAIAEHLGVVVPDPHHPEVVLLLDQGQQVAAIKQYREETGADLLTAKNAVEEMARRL
ncbi:hypothetical protein [Modestobacter italicus]|uniref:hypothetical protein n=1 Tax=Modestobacter italicus (strain DSM 44449 / CECT 9708 / BC 501) TaxID=2732864 RepID=UPI001C9661AB|nr:hypothetical protein [Modestobacter italicus]